MSGKENKKEYFTNAQIKLLITTRLKYESEFTGGRKSKSFLWGKILSEIKSEVPDFNYDKMQIHRKFLNIMITYKRIKNRNKKTGRDAITWDHFDVLDAVYGTKHSIKPPAENLISSIVTTNLSYDPTSASYDATPAPYEPTPAACDPFPASHDPSTVEIMFSEDVADDNYQVQDDIIPNKRPRRTKENETLEFLRQEAQREDKRHAKVMELEKQKLETERERLQEMRDLKTVLQQMLQNQNSNT